MFFCTRDFHDLVRSFNDRISDFKILGYALYLCARFIAYVNPRRSWVSLSLEIGNTFVILGYLQAK